MIRSLLPFLRAAQLAVQPTQAIALTRREAEARLNAVAPAIRALGVQRLALFGVDIRPNECSFRLCAGF